MNEVVRPCGPKPEKNADEILEVVDPDGRVVGWSPRSACHGNPALAHRAVHVLVRNATGSFFLQRRSRRKAICPGLWDASVGGHVAPGESYEAAALREMDEEIGLRQVALRRVHDYVWRTDVETEHVRTFIVIAEGPFRLRRDEIEEGRFWTVGELRRAAGTGALTPNLEEELRRLGVLSPPRPEGQGAGGA